MKTSYIPDQILNLLVAKEKKKKEGKEKNAL